MRNWIQHGRSAAVAGVAFAAGNLTDGAAVAGALLITHGVDLVWRPLAFVVGGGFLLTGAWLSARQGG